MTVESSQIMVGETLNEYDLSKDYGTTFTVSNTLLGNGSFGKVYVAHDEKGNELAIKCCDVDSKSGIPSILEASIMSTIVHPHLSSAVRIQASDSGLFLIQKLARCDLSNYSSKNKQNRTPTLFQLRTWTMAMASALDCLHKEHIIHADVKASNILLYDNDVVKLTDFTLAVKKWDHNTEKFYHKVCTSTHRPLECILKTGWDYSLDIWSLGCSLYEIAYGELLFPHQGGDTKNKVLVGKRALRCLIDWANGPGNSPGYNVDDYAVNNYVPYTLCKEYSNPVISDFNDLIGQMLLVNPHKRITIPEILKHRFLTGIPVIQSPHVNIDRPSRKLSNVELARISTHMQRYLPKSKEDNAHIENLAYNIYKKCTDLDTISERDQIITCIWIAAKIVTGVPPKFNNPNIPSLDNILNIERIICHNLYFRVHR
jgi:serine/threonine protein kinase